ncbi:olfactory receptor 150-like [Rana temporaria]|uniref:olfactory receptor 150-like n=1 Tax=Rana temporaria TaxID=8407 RepID=UPI001AADD4B3|nr:olfactory receptor 150-like [Rana temporaria]
MNSTHLNFFDYFIIVGISDVPEMQLPIFLIVLFIYLITFGGNMTILSLICLDHRLHIPMYFFLANLSILDMASSSVTLFKILASFITGNSMISYQACILQLYICASLIGLELLILTAMSYDRYVAICNPLNYHMVMNHRVSVLLAAVCWLWAFLECLPHTIIIFNFACYKSNRINHFFCDILPLKNLTCCSTTILSQLMLAVDLFHLFFSFPLTFIPYVFIITTILRIPSSVGRHKAFRTCSSHLTVVILLYVVLLCQYLIPNQEAQSNSNKLFSLVNTAAVPMLNPLIYSLKNKDVKLALGREVNKVRAFFNYDKLK